MADPALGADLTLRWTDNANGSATFKIHRKTGVAGSYGLLGTTATGETTFLDSGVTLGTVYCYRVQASNAGGDSAFSNEACGSVRVDLDVTVAKAGSGSGTVTSSPLGVDCGTDCSERFAGGAIVTLTAAPSAGSSFTGWSGGGCSGTDPCTVAGNTSVAVTATFAAVPSSGPVVVDNGDPGTQASGTWTPLSMPSSYGGTSLVSPGPATARYQWAASLPETRLYNVWAWWTSDATRSRRAEYRVTHASGTRIVRLNQRTSGGQWVFLGAYKFVAGTPARVELSNPDGASVSADAVRFVRK